MAPTIDHICRSRSGIRRSFLAETDETGISPDRSSTVSSAYIQHWTGHFVAWSLRHFRGILFLSQYMQLILGLSPLEAGMWMLPWALAFVVGSTLISRIVRRIQPILIIAGGLAVTAVGFGLLIHIDESTSFLYLSTGLVISSLGIASVFTLTTDLVVGSAPTERAGVASAISETTGELGGALGIAILGSIGTSIYRTELARAWILSKIRNVVLRIMA